MKRGLEKIFERNNVYRDIVFLVGGCWLTTAISKHLNHAKHYRIGKLQLADLPPRKRRILLARESKPLLIAKFQLVCRERQFHSGE